jgi:hypothetical protein
MDATITLDREETQTPVAETQVEETKVQSKPDVSTFKSVVARHLKQWRFETVEQLCVPQTQALIDELATLFV